MFFSEGTSSLLSLVKAFDSVLAVYEGFCHLKQVQFSFPLNLRLESERLGFGVGALSRQIRVFLFYFVQC